MACAPSHLIPERHPGGRPRTVSFSPEEMEKLGQEMINYIYNNIGDIVHLSDWYTLEKSFTYKQWKTFIHREEFIPYYEKALRIIGKKYLIKDTDIEPSLKHRWLRHYFADLREQEDEDAKFASRLKAEEAVAVDETFTAKFDNFTKAIDIAQASSKALKSSDTNSKAEAKS